MAYPSQQAYPGAPPPKKSSNRGCLIALAIVGSLGLLSVIGVAIAIYSIAQNEDVRKIASAVGEGMEIMKEAQTAPGTDELRKLGCDQAMVLDMQRLAKLAEGFHDGGTAMPPDMPGKLVMCIVRETSSAPTCAATSKAYLAAVPTPTKRFAVTVEAQQNKKTQCSEVYDPTGKSLGQFDKSTAPPVPSPEQ
jgi:hypothetical protein